MKVKHLRPGDWVVTSWHEVEGSSWQRLQGLLLGIERRPGNAAGPIAYVLSAVSGVRTVQASHVLERREP
jgi:hypothetical protein